MAQEEVSREINEKTASIWENIFFYELKQRERKKLKTFSNFTEQTLTYT